MAFEITLGKEQDACFQTLNVSDVVSCMGLEGRIAAHRRSEERSYMTLKRIIKVKRLNDMVAKYSYIFIRLEATCMFQK